jgi:hypothetical protein
LGRRRGRRFPNEIRRHVAALIRLLRNLKIGYPSFDLHIIQLRPWEWWQLAWMRILKQPILQWGWYYTTVYV